MEEILASIRKIIEDGDPALTSQNKSAAVEPVKQEPDAVAPAEEAAFREDFGREAPVAAGDTAETTVSSAPRSLSDLHDGLRQSASEGGQVVPMPTAASVANQAENEPAPAPASEARGLTPPASDADNRPPEPAAAPIGPVQPGISTAPPPEVAGSRPSIISEAAGRQVTAAFEELSEAFAASRKRSFDEMAEEMIRPMLREWMDNNLPMLVERLVREEIERVARGA